jgi:hypothetical protein
MDHLHHPEPTPTWTPGVDLEPAYDDAPPSHDWAPDEASVGGWTPDDGFLATFGIEHEVPPLLRSLRVLAGDDVGVHELMTRTSEAAWARFLANLDPTVSAEDGPLLARAEMIRSTGMTFDQMATTQLEFMEGRGDELDESVGEQMANQAGKTPHTANVPDEWGDATPKQRRRWNRQAKQVIASVRAGAPPEIQAILAGTEIVWDPDGVGRAFTTSNDDGMHVGVAWLVAAQADPANVYSAFAHEMLGHPGYSHPNDFEGDYLAGPIMNRVHDQLSPAQQHSADRSNWTLGYSYMETEIFAELIEWTYDTPTSANDHPFEMDPDGNPVDARSRVNEVPNHLQLIRDSFAPTLAEGIVRGLWLRVQRESHIIPAAREKFKHAVLDILGIDL